MARAWLQFQHKSWNCSGNPCCLTYFHELLAVGVVFLCLFPPPSMWSMVKNAGLSSPQHAHFPPYLKMASALSLFLILPMCFLWLSAFFGHTFRLDLLHSTQVLVDTIRGERCPYLHGFPVLYWVKPDSMASCLVIGIPYATMWWGPCQPPHKQTRST